MEYAFLTALLFAWSVSCARQSTRHHGPNLANAGRILVAFAVIGAWVSLSGRHVLAPGWPWLVLSGALGLGLGDIALFNALPRIGPALTILLMQCLAAPFALAIEYLMLGTTVTWTQAGSAALILVGVAVALGAAPEGSTDRRERRVGVALGVLAAFGQACGAVSTPLARHACDLAGGVMPDGIGQAFMRLLGGVPVVLGYALWQTRQAGILAGVPRPYDRRRGLGWMLMNGLSGPAFGVACYQYALTHHPAALVLSVVALTPLLALPMQWATEGRRPGWRAWLGGSIAVLGAALLKWLSA